MSSLICNDELNSLRMTSINFIIMSNWHYIKLRKDKSVQIVMWWKLPDYYTVFCNHNGWSSVAIVTIHAFVAMRWKANSQFSGDEPKKEMSLCRKCNCIGSKLVCFDLRAKNHSDWEAEIHIAVTLGDSFSKQLRGDRALSALQVVKANKTAALPPTVGPAHLFHLSGWWIWFYKIWLFLASC